MTRMNRRHILETVSLMGIGTTTFQRALADEAARKPGLTSEQISNAEWVAGITLSEKQRIELINRLDEIRRDSEQIRKIPLQYESLPSFRFDPEMADPDSVSRAAGKPVYPPDVYPRGSSR